MRRTLTFLLALIVSTACPSRAATYYVNPAAGSAIHGFLAVGNNSNSGLTLSLPKATIDAAQTAASAGDTIYCNFATYKENSSAANRLIISKALTIATYPQALSEAGKATLQSNNNTLCFSVTSTSQATLQDFIIDGQTNGVQVGRLDASCNIYLFRDDIVNVTGASTTAIATNGTNVTCVAENCTTTAANGNAVGTRPYGMNSAGWLLTFLGGVYDGIFSPFSSGSVVNGTLLKAGLARDGSPVQVSNCTHGFVLQAGAVTLSTLDIEYCIFSNLSNSIVETPSTALTVTSWTVDHCVTTADAQVSLHPSCTVSGGEIAYNYHNKANSFIQTREPSFSSVLFHDNSIYQTSSTGDPIDIVYGGSGLQIYRNYVSSDTTGHLCKIGRDGAANLVSNTAAATGSVKLGDTSSDAYVAQTFTSLASTVLDQGTKVASLRLKFTSVGSPVGSETVSIYGDNAGSPNTSLEQSSYTLQDTAVTSTSTWVDCPLPSHTSTTSATAYWVVAHHNGTADASNYVTLASNVATTSVKTSSNGSSWSAGSASLLYQVRYGAYEIVNPLVYDNTFISTSTSSAPHGLLVGASTGCKVYRNIILGAGIGLISKMVEGGGAQTSLWWDNLIYSATTGSNALGGLVSKGSNGTVFLHNTVVLNVANSNCAYAFSDYEGTLTPQLNGQADVNAVFKDNILIGAGPSGSGTMFLLGNNNVAQPSTTGTTFDDNICYVGSNYRAMVDFTSGSQVNRTASQMQSAGYNPSGLFTDPLLVNEVNPSTPGEFRPTSSSPAIRAGVDGSAIISPYNDYFGVGFITPNPTIGAVNPLMMSVSSSRSSSTSRTTSSSRSASSSRAVLTGQ